MFWFGLVWFVFDKEINKLLRDEGSSYNVTLAVNTSNYGGVGGERKTFNAYNLVGTFRHTFDLGEAETILSYLITIEDLDGKYGRGGGGGKVWRTQDGGGGIFLKTLTETLMKGGCRGEGGEMKSIGRFFHF